ncbi:MAG: hypothetical protein K9G42_00750 [Pedobacter sp.]|nr:hypothetical protein [Pedobacter sp.]
MKKILFITLLSVYLLGNTDLIQLIRLPMLLVHYQNHLKENSRLDLIYFLSSHYSAHGDGISSDDKEEKEMPFMQSNQRSINISLVNLSDLSIIPPSVNYIHTKYTIFQQFYISDIHTLSLLRPPIRLS